MPDQSHYAVVDVRDEIMRLIDRAESDIAYTVMHSALSWPPDPVVPLTIKQIDEMILMYRRQFRISVLQAIYHKLESNGVVFQWAYPPYYT